MSKKTGIDQMSSALGAFIDVINNYPGWKEWNKNKLGYVLSDDLRDVFYHDKEIPKEFHFSDEIEQQHNVMMLYLQLHSTLNALKDVEYYFRRYPFHDLPVSHHSHLTYMCEMYFSRFYEFRERLKKYLNAMNKMVSKGKLDVGGFLKLFNKVFEQELKERNQIHHHESFDDLDIHHIFLTSLMPDEKGWNKERTHIYRRTTKVWAERVKKRSSRLEEFLEAVANASVMHCDFLRDLVRKQEKT